VLIKLIQCNRAPKALKTKTGQSPESFNKILHLTIVSTLTKKFTQKAMFQIKSSST